MRTLLMEHRPEGAALALLEGRELMDWRLVPEQGLQAETVLVGRVRQNARGMAAAFVSLPRCQYFMTRMAEPRGYSLPVYSVRRVTPASRKAFV